MSLPTSRFTVPAKRSTSARVLLRAIGHSPMTGAGTASFEIKGPKGDTVTSGASAIIDSVVGFSWDIPASQAGGEYTVRIFHPSGAPAERKFDIRAYRAPRLKSQIVFVRDGYGPGRYGCRQPPCRTRRRRHSRRSQSVRHCPRGWRRHMERRNHRRWFRQRRRHLQAARSYSARRRRHRHDHSGWRNRRDRYQDHSHSFADDGPGNLSRRRRSDRGPAEPRLH